MFLRSHSKSTLGVAGAEPELPGGVRSEGEHHGSVSGERFWASVRVIPSMPKARELQAASEDASPRQRVLAEGSRSTLGPASGRDAPGRRRSQELQVTSQETFPQKLSALAMRRVARSRPLHRIARRASAPATGGP